MRLIDADELEELFRATIAVIAKRPDLTGDLEHMIKASAMAVKMIEDAPTVEERKKGEWILHENQRQEEVDNGNYLYVCSECGKSDLHAKTQEVPFCWWCGADMREEVE